MFTLFAVPKPFTGHIDTIQRNALASWQRLNCEILLLGGGSDVAKVAAETGVRHIPDIACSPEGTPLLSDLFARAEAEAAYDVLCYVNADIILMSDFSAALAQVQASWQQFLLVGQRWDTDIDELLAFGLQWEQEVRAFALAHGQAHGPGGMDYFAFSAGLWRDIPPFWLGRLVFDNWLLYAARSAGIPVIDATHRVLAIHQNHTYGHIPGIQSGGLRNTPETRANIALGRGCAGTFTLRDATHRLSASGITLRRDWWTHYRTLSLRRGWEWLCTPVQLYRQWRVRDD